MDQRTSIPPNGIIGGAEEPPPMFSSLIPRSPSLSFKGWVFGVWLRKNKRFIKTVLAPVSAALTVGGALDVATLRFVGTLLALGLVTLLFKLAFDAFDYFVTEDPT